MSSSDRDVEDAVPVIARVAARPHKIVRASALPKSLQNTRCSRLNTRRGRSFRHFASPSDGNAHLVHEMHSNFRRSGESRIEHPAFVCEFLRMACYTDPNLLHLGTEANLPRFKSVNALSNWPRNRLLLALPSRNLTRLMAELEHIRCQRGQVLVDADSPLDHIFFPDSGVVSVVAVYAGGRVIEMATIGREGCTGMQAFFGAKVFFYKVFGPDLRECSQNVARSFRPRDAVNTVIPKSYVRVHPRISRAGPGVGGVQRCAQPQGAVGALAAHDA